MGLAERRESASPRLQTPGTNPRCPSICQPTQQTHTHWKAFSGSSMARRQGQQQSHQCRERGAATDSNLPRSRSRRDERWPGVWPLASVAVRLTNRRGRCQETKSRLTAARPNWAIGFSCSRGGHCRETKSRLPRAPHPLPLPSALVEPEARGRLMGLVFGAATWL